ncbi:hypothetical protein JCM3770_002677 [Rhodotorula araucariae]
MSSPPSRPVQATPSVDDEIDRSTLRFISASLRDPYLPWLVRLALLTLAAKLVRVCSPALFRLVARLASYSWTALAALIRFAAWSATWVGLVALVVWVLIGIAAAAVYVALSLRPQYRAWARPRPLQAAVAQKAAVYGAAAILARRVLGAWLAQAVLLAFAAREAWAFFHRGVPPAPAPAGVDTAPPPVHPPDVGSPDDPVSPAGTSDESADAVDDAELERWARQAKEELLRDSLLRQGRKTGTGTGTGAGTGTGTAADSEGAQSTVDDERGV